MEYKEIESNDPDIGEKNTCCPKFYQLCNTDGVSRTKIIYTFSIWFSCICLV